MPSANIGIYFT